MNAAESELLMIGAGALALVYLVNKAGQAAGAVVSGANQAVATGVGAVGSVFGLPTPNQTIDDPVRVRQMIDTQGWYEASKWATAGALIKAMAMPSTSSGNVGTSTPRLDTPAGMTWQEGVTNSVDPFDPRYYGANGNIVLPSQTNTAGPGGAYTATGTSGNSSLFFSNAGALGNLSGM